MARDQRHDGFTPQGQDPWSRDDAPEWRSELAGKSSSHSSSHEAADYTRFGFKELGSPDVMNAYLDGELSRRSPRFRAALVGSRKFRADLSAMEELDAELGRHPLGPDLTDSIMDRLGRSGKFATVAPHRFVTMGRMATAASVLLALSASVLVVRSTPNLFSRGTTPLDAVVRGSAEPTKIEAAGPRVAYAGFVPSVGAPDQSSLGGGVSTTRSWPDGSSPSLASSTPKPSRHLATGSPIPLVRGMLAQLGRGVNGNGTFEVRTSGSGLAGSFANLAETPGNAAGLPGVMAACVSPEKLWANPESRAWSDALVVADQRALRSPRRSDAWSGPTVWAMDLSSAPGWRLVPVDADAGYASDGISGRRHR